MSIAGKEWYRNTFLKSEEWKTFRSQVLVDAKARCFICGNEDSSNDVHHVWYGDPSFTGARQFVVLCRSCHRVVHNLFLPAGAKSERDKVEAWKSLNRCRNLILGYVDNKPKDISARVGVLIKQEKRRSRCRGCGADDTRTRWIHPITQNEVTCQTSGAMCLCEDCLARLKKQFEPREYGTASLWRELKEFLNSIPECDLTNSLPREIFNPS